MKNIFCIIAAILCVAVLAGCRFLPAENTPTIPSETTQETTVETTEPAPVIETGYLAAMTPEIEYFDKTGASLGMLTRGAEISYMVLPDGEKEFLVNDEPVCLQEGAAVVADAASVIPTHTLYVRSAVNLRDAEGRLLETFMDKGAAVEVCGYDYLENGMPHMYQVSGGYIMPWYVTDTEEAALANYDDGHYATHADRGNRFGGGSADNLDYFPRVKDPIEGNVMPDECRTLYVPSWRLGEIDSYIEIAEGCDINAFVVDIAASADIGYVAEVMGQTCPSAVDNANNSVEDYQTAVKKLQDKGYYVIGRIMAFNDDVLVADHPEYAITDTEGNPLKLNGSYWPTPYSRAVWQYKVDQAVEAVELMGFNEIQYDFVRFPELTQSYEKNGTIDFHNTYGETKAQAIQRFLMYAADILREKGVYVSADVFGESAFNYVTAYGQYWPAISNVVDAISGMPYPDHFSADGDYLPWEHPYNTLYNWGCSVQYRQQETATPAAVRTWIQAYNAIREPYNTYGPTEVFSQIRGLRDSGCTGGYMTWHASGSIEKYRYLMPAFTAPEEE